LTRTTFAALLLAGGVLRAIALAAPGTGDVTVWKVWTYNAARGRVATMYGVGGTPPERRILQYAGAEASVDYPPIALYELGVAGRLYRVWSRGSFPNTAALTAFVKLPAVACDIALALLIFVLVRARCGESIARWSTLAYWLNPAVLLDASVLGYLDTQFVLPVAGALVAAATGWAAAAGGLFAVSLLTKAQALFIGPALALAIWTNSSSRRQRARDVAFAIAAFAAVATLAIAPTVIAGGWPNMAQALSRLAHHDMLSANNCNLWWLAGYAIRARASMADLGLWAAITRPTQILGIPRFVELGYPNPRAVGTLLTLAAAAWAVWTARRARDVWLVAAVAAFLVHAYSTLSAQVHENHAFAAVPLLVIAAAGRTRFRPIVAIVSVIVALNLNLFYGLGNGVGYAIPRGITIVDATIVLAIVNCAALWAHARVLKIECSTAGASRRTPTPASRPAPAVHSRS
jgi:hypothetical protein